MGRDGGTRNVRVRRRAPYALPIVFLRTPVTCCSSSRVLGTPSIRQAAYTAAATIASIDRPRTRPFSRAFLQMNPASSFTGRGSPIREATRTRMAGMTLEFAHPVELLALAERDRVAPGVLVRERNHGREPGCARDVAARSPRAGEAVILFDRVGGPLGAFINRPFADHETARIADKLAARVVAHEVLAPTFRADPVFFHDRFRWRTARHDQPSGGLLLSGLKSVNITRLYYTLSSFAVTT